MDEDERVQGIVSARDLVAHFRTVILRSKDNCRDRIQLYDGI